MFGSNYWASNYWSSAYFGARAVTSTPSGYNTEDMYSEEEELLLFARVIIDIIEGKL